jgi:hypothetical protein
MTRQEDSFLQMTIMICYLYVIWTDGERGVEFPERKGLHPLTLVCLYTISSDKPKGILIPPVHSHGDVTMHKSIIFYYLYVLWRDGQPGAESFNLIYACIH